MYADTPQHIVSLDIETLGTRPGDVVVTVGFVVLLLGGDVVHRETIGIDVASSLAAGLKIEASTLRWWMVEAPEAARRALFDAPAIPLAEATLRIRELARIWCRSANCRGVYGWGAVFDNALLHAALRAGGLAEPAWNFRLDLCGRTLAKQWGVKIASDEPHVASADALAQGRAVLAALDAQREAREALRKQREAEAEGMQPDPRTAEPVRSVKEFDTFRLLRPGNVAGMTMPGGAMPAATPLDAVDRQCADVVAAAIAEAAGTPEVAIARAALDTGIAAGARLAADLGTDPASESFAAAHHQV